jgi:dUTP pyrophosphatase
MRYDNSVMRPDPMIKIKLDMGAIAPVRAHTWDGGLDLFAPNDCIIPPSVITGDSYISEDGTSYECVEVGSAVIDTGVHLEIPEGYYGEVHSKSGLMCKSGLTTDGTIDAHYTGSIRVCLFNHRGVEYCVKAGDKIAQLVIAPCIFPRLELVDSLEETDRGDNGFGSTGR